MTLQTTEATWRVSADRDSLAKEGIRKFNETVTAASRNQDAAAKASLWTENTRVLPPGQEMITGRAAVQAFWQSRFDQGAYDVVLESVEIKSLGDGVAYEIGRNITRVRTADGSSIDVPGKSLCIFRREGDGVGAPMWTSSMQCNKELTKAVPAVIFGGHAPGLGSK